VAIDRPKEPPKFDDDEFDFGDAFPSERPTAPAPDGGPGTGDEERPTVSPPYDVEEFAKSSDSKVRAARTPNPQQSPRMPPPGDAATRPPPVPDFDLSEELPPILGGGGSAYSPPPARPPQITLTDENELETARLRSVMLPSDVPPARKASDSDQAPPTVAYPADYEKDPFAHLNTTPSSRAAGPLAGQLREMHDKFSLGDYTGALEVAETLLRTDPVNGEALECAEECREKLLQMYTARIGPLDRVPVVMVPREQLRWLSIDHRAGFLLSHIDGISSLEMILDVSGMPLLDALKILCELVQQRVITLR
jgi:hypothetical protein